MVLADFFSSQLFALARIFLYKRMKKKVISLLYFTHSSRKCSGGLAKKISSIRSV